MGDKEEREREREREGGGGGGGESTSKGRESGIERDYTMISTILRPHSTHTPKAYTTVTPVALFEDHTNNL